MNSMQGVIRGKTIELDEAPALPNGQAVAVTLRPLTSPEESLRRAAESWADDEAGLEKFLEEARLSRKASRPEPVS
jgi:hypothetical protein